MGSVNNNEIVGNQWDVISDPQFVATAVLVFLAGDADMNHNRISGDGTDIGVAAFFSGTVNVMNNAIERMAPGPEDTIDVAGVGVWFFDNDGPSKVVRNSFSGWNPDFLGAQVEQVNSGSDP